MKRGGQTKERILSETIRLVHQKGIEATSINDLIAATGLQKGSLYFHFSGKEELTLAALEMAKTKFEEFLSSALAGRTPGEKLHNYFKGVLEINEKRKFADG
ncbi:MAG: TetR/AcrR family transcriptional regulator [Nitrospiraceae bacterium]|nr:TetR/AcrR family transcriptional regulator [Nitrospiraceae bacterium]